MFVISWGGPVGLHDVLGWLLGIVDAFQNASYAASSILLPVTLDRSVFSSPGLASGGRWRWWLSSWSVGARWYPGKNIMEIKEKALVGGFFVLGV